MMVLSLDFLYFGNVLVSICLFNFLVPQDVLILIFPYCLTDALKSHLVPCSRIRDKIKRILELSKGERNWRNILREDPETESHEGTTPPIDSLSFSLVTRRSLEVLGYAPRILNRLTLVERLYADHIMS